MATSVTKNSQEGASDTSPIVTRSDTETSLDSQTNSPRKRERHDDLVKLFKLPASEYLVDDFICALRRRVLYQGRLYIFEHYACFHSRIFNHQRLVVIPLKEVTQIRPKKHYGFPNSIEIVWRGKKYFLTSFLKRDSAHKLLTYAWGKTTPYAKLFGGVSEGSEPSSPRGPNTTDSKKLLGSSKLGKLVYRPLSETSLRSPREEHSDAGFDGEDMQSQASKPSFNAPSISEAPIHDSDSDDESESAVEGLEHWVPVSEAAPPPSSGMTHLLDAEFDIPVREFYKEFLSEQSQFFITWHESRGDTKVQLLEWHKHAVGYVRELTFVTPLKQRIGPSKCLCTQTQRTRLHPGDHLIFETSQIMDIPYGDHFSVEARWDITPDDDGKHSKVVVRLGIPFSKKTIFKSTIESSTKQLVKEACENWVATAHRWLEPPIPLHPTIPSSAFAGSTGSSEGQDNFHEATHLTRAQSLAVRLSSDRLPDIDVLMKAPVAHRSDIARVLQLRRLESDKHIANLIASDRLKSKTVSFKSESPFAKPESRWAGACRSHPFLLSTVFGILVLQVLFLLWRKRGGGVPHFGTFFPKDRVAYRFSYNSPALSDNEVPDVTVLFEHLESIKRSLREIQQETAVLQGRLDACSRKM